MDAFAELLKRLDPEDGANRMDNNSVLNKSVTNAGLNKLTTNATPMAANPKATLKATPSKGMPLGDIAGKATMGLESIGNMITDMSGKNYDTSADSTVKGLNVADIGSSAIQGFATGTQMGGPIAGAALGLAQVGAKIIGNNKAKKEWAKNRLNKGRKESHLAQLALDQQYQMEEGKAVVGDMIAIRKKELGYTT